MDEEREGVAEGDKGGEEKGMNGVKNLGGAQKGI